MTDTPEPKRGRGRPRREGTDEDILAVTQEMLRGGGYGALTVDEVAERAGVAKTTLYRRWPSKSALVAAAIAPLPSGARDVDGVLSETTQLLRLFRDAGADAIDVVAEILRPRHEQLRAVLGEGEADRLIGALLTRLFVTRKL